jgi:hypothetical protein
MRRATGSTSVTGVRPLPRILPIIERAIPAIVERCVTAIATKFVELVSVAPDAAHMGSTKTVVQVSTTEAAYTASDEPADTTSAKGANMTSAEAANMPSAKAANMPSAEAATVATAPTAAAATGLRVGCKQAAGQRRGHQDSHYPSQHEFFLSVCAAASPPWFAEPIRPVSTETDRSPGQDLVRAFAGAFGFLSPLICSCGNR